MSTEMKKVLLILSFLRNTPKSAEEAINIAKEKGAELIIFFVLDIEFAERIAHRLTDEGWIGGRPSEQLYTSILREYKIQSELRTQEIEKSAAAVGVSARSIIKSGTLLDETRKIVQLEEPDLIVISRRKRSNLSRLIFGSLVTALKNQVACEVRIIDAE